MFRLRRSVVLLTAACAAMLACTAAPASAAGAPRTAKTGTTTGWNRYFQASTEGYFTSIAAIDATDAWTVGYLVNLQGLIARPFIRQWDGHTWNTVTIPGGPAFRSSSVAASSASDVWVMGLSASGTTTTAYRFDGSAWQAIAIPARTLLNSPVVIAPDDVWTLGTSGTMHGNIFHWNGSAWTGSTIGGATLQALSGTRSGNLWAAGTTSANHNLAVYNWNGSAWTTVSMSHPAATGNVGLYVSSASDVWVGGQGSPATFALHWNGATWTKVSVPSSLSSWASADLVPDGTGGLWFGPQVHWTGRTWHGPIPILPSTWQAWIPGPVVRVPGTSSYWMASGTLDQGSVQMEPTVYRYGPVPRSREQRQAGVNRST